MGLIDYELGQPPIGFPCANVTGRLYNRTGETLQPGSVVALDFDQGTAECTGFNEGSASGIFATAIEPDAGEAGAGKFAVYTGNISWINDAIGVCKAKGRCQALVLTAAGGVAAGEPLYVGTGSTYGFYLTDVTQAASAATIGAKPVARVLTAVTDTNAAPTLVDVIFDGDDGFGGAWAAS